MDAKKQLETDYVQHPIPIVIRSLNFHKMTTGTRTNSRRRLQGTNTCRRTTRTLFTSTRKNPILIRRVPIFQLLLLCYFHTSSILVVLASSRGPPPPPPPHQGGTPRDSSSYEHDRYYDNDVDVNVNIDRRRKNHDQDEVERRRRDYNMSRFDRDRDRDRDFDRERDQEQRGRDHGLERQYDRDFDRRQHAGPNSVDRDYVPSRRRRVEKARSDPIPIDPSRRQKSRGYGMFSRKSSENDRLNDLDVDVDANANADVDADADADPDVSSNQRGISYSANDNNPINNNEAGNANVVNNEEEPVYNPIDYKFPARNYNKDANLSDDKDTEIDELPRTRNIEDEDNKEVGPNFDSDRRQRVPQYESARKDAVARYSFTKLGKLKLAVSSFCVGGAVGGFAGQSMFNQGKLFVFISGFLFFVISFLRNDYGEMARSLGLASIYLARRTKAVRRQYRTGPHVRAMCRIGKRKPFPPVLEDSEENPWKYAPQSRNDPNFEMIKALVCMLLVGSFCGGSVPLIPTWMGSSAGAAAFGLFGIAKNARGDLIRSMGMRIVALASEASGINAELRVAKKVARVGGKLFDKMMILDRKHRIKDRVVQGASWAYTKAANTAARVQEDVKEGKENRDFRERDEESPRR